MPSSARRWPASSPRPRSPPSATSGGWTRWAPAARSGCTPRRPTGPPAARGRGACARPAWSSAARRVSGRGARAPRYVPRPMTVLDLVDRWPVDHVAAGIAITDGTTQTTGDTGRIFAWASVTKLLTAMAALLAIEEGVIGLDHPAGPPGATVRHLLAHASGLGPEGGV